MVNDQDVLTLGIRQHDGDHQAWLSRHDHKGDTVWEHEYGIPGNETTRGLTHTTTGGFAFVGSQKSPDGDDDIWLVQTDSEGGLIWDRRFGDPAGQEQGQEVLSLEDGGFAIGANTTTKGAGHMDFWLIRTDDDGQLLWDRTYGSAKTDMLYALCAVDGGFALAGERWDEEEGVYAWWLIRTDHMGEILWEKRHVTGILGFARDVAITPDGGFILAGHSLILGDEKGRQLHALRIDPPGTLAWERSYGGLGEDKGAGVFVHADGALSLVGSTWKSGLDQDAWLLRTDALGFVIWDRTFGAEGQDSFIAALGLPDGGVAALGWQGGENASGTDRLLVRTDPTGHAACGIE